MRYRETEPPPLPEVKDKRYSFSIVLGPNTDPVPVKGPEELSELMEKIKGLGPIKTETVWSRLTGLSQMTRIDIMERYGERVAGGQFEGWHKIGLGKKWWIIFQIQDREILFRVGPHEDVYATHRRKHRDSTRSL